MRKHVCGSAAANLATEETTDTMNRALLSGAAVARLAILGLWIGSAALSSSTRAADQLTRDFAEALESRALVSDGLQRQYWVHAPTTATSGGGLVFVLHGSNGDGPGMREMMGPRLEALTDAAGFHVVYPDGFERHWNDCRALANYSANRRNIDDPKFLRAIVAELRSSASIDPRRVFAIGMSNGGHMVLRLALEDAMTYAGLAAIAANLPAPAGRDCVAGTGAVPLVLFAGTADPINPYLGGLVRVGDDASRGHVLAAEYTASWFARRAGHVRDPIRRQFADRDTTDGSRAERLAWTQAGKAPVLLYILHGGGHTIPGTARRSPTSRAVTNRDIDAAEESWRLFRRVDPGRMADTRPVSHSGPRYHALTIVGIRGGIVSVVS